MDYYICHPLTRIRLTGAKYSLIRCDYDYTRKDIMVINEISVRIFEFLAKVRSYDEIKSAFLHDFEDIDGLDFFLSFMTEQGYLNAWKEEKNEKYFSDIIKEEFIPNRTFCSCTFELTPKCNFNCVHCYLASHRELSQRLSTDDVKTIIDKLYKNGILEIYLSGGEPLLRKDFKEIYLYIRKKGILVEIFSNGYLITDDMIELFKEFPPLEIDVSLYGASDETYKKITGVNGAFSRIIANIKKCKENGINISIKTPVFSLLKDDLAQIAQIAKDLKVSYRNAFEINPTIDDEESTYDYQISPEEVALLKKKYSTTYLADVNTLREFLKNPTAPAKGKRYLCSTGQCSSFIDYEGKMAPCIELRHKGMSILDNDFSTIWKGIKDLAFEKLAENECEYKCMNCKLLVICKSCPAIRERMNGSAITITDRDCVFAQELFKVMKGELNERQ